MTSEKQSKKQKDKKKKDVWRIPGLVTRIDSLIRNGTLKSDGMDKLYDTIKTEFAEVLAVPEYQLNKGKFRRKVLELVWSPKVLSEIKSAVRRRFDPNKVYEVVSYIPRKIFDAKWKKLRGKPVSGRGASYTVRGVLRLSDELAEFSGDPIDFEEGTYEKPFEIHTKNSAFKFSVPNGTNLGIPYSGVIEENPARQAFEGANRFGDTAVILTNFLNLPLKRASGPLIIHRALLSGTTVNPETMDPRYIEKAQRILKLKPHDEMVYQTTSEAFLDLMCGWGKIVGTKEKPIYKGPVYIVLGYQEEEIIAAGAYWEAHYFNLRQQNLLQVQMRIVKGSLAAVGLNIKKLELRLANLSGNGDGAAKEIKRQIGRLEVEEDELREKLEEIEDELARTRITYISKDDLKQYYFKVMRFMIKTLEETIPNAKVIGIGTTHVKIGGKRVKIDIPDHNSPTDELLSEYCSGYGTEVLKGRIVDDVIICHPYSPNFRMTVRQVDSDGQRRPMGVFVAPIAVDEIYIYKVIRNTVRRVTEISKAMKGQFSAGVLRLACVNGILQPENWSVPALHDFYRKVCSQRSSTNPCSKYIYTFLGTDPHYGSASREILVGPDGRHFGVAEAFIEMMRRDGLLTPEKIPVHMFVQNDDWTQGHHFPAEQQPDRGKMSTQEIEERLIALKKKITLEKDQSKRNNLVNKLQELVMKQIELRPPYWPQEQMIEVLERFIGPNVDFFDAMLARDVKVSLEAKGMTDYTGELKDTCDAGLVVFGTGNHFFKTVMGQLTEGFIYARELRLLLRAIPHPYWRDKVEFLDKLVSAPLYGNILVGWGTVQLDDKYIYGTEHRSSPTGQMDWGDPLKGVVRNDAQRGNVSRIHNGRYVIKTYGDKHFLGVVITPYGVYIMGPPAVHTDKFAEYKYGFPANNTGIAILGVPAEGPDKGPTLVRFLMYEHLKEFFEKGKPFDWKSFLPNPA
jgi:hypothetical protein